MLNLAFIKQRGSRLLSGAKTYKELADKQWTLCPGEMTHPPTAIYLDGELDKVTAVPDDTTIDRELTRVKGGNERRHVPSVAYRLRDVALVDNSLYKSSMRLPLSMDKPRLTVPGPAEYLEKGALACSFTGVRYFGHWMWDDVPIHLAAQELGQPVRGSIPYTSHQSEYSALFDIHANSVTNARFKELVIIEDYGQNSYKQSRYLHMRRQLHRVASSRKADNVMLLRGSTGVARILVNENEVAEFLAKKGFDILQPNETMSANEIVARTLDARIVVGVEGSQLAHGLFTMRENGALLVLQPPYRFNNVQKDITDCCGTTYSFMVGRQVEKGFEIDLDQLSRTLELVHSRLGH